MQSCEIEIVSRSRCCDVPSKMIFPVINRGELRWDPASPTSIRTHFDDFYWASEVRYVLTGRCAAAEPPIFGQAASKPITRRLPSASMAAAMRGSLDP